MSIPVYPVLNSDDPNPDSWMPGITEDPTIASKKLSGLISTRARYTRVPRTWSYEYKMLTDAEKQLLERFERDEVHFRAISFYWINWQEAYGADARKPNTDYVLNQIVQPLIPNGRSYRCTTAGKSHASATPTWPTAVNGTVVDGTVVWTENTYRVRFGDKINFQVGDRIDLWRAGVMVAEV